MTPEELRQIANAPGYGNGKIARDRMAAERDIRAILPDPRALPLVFATRHTGDRVMPLCHFGCSGIDGNDWSIVMQDGMETDALGMDDAATDAQTVAAILNAYRMGIIVVREPQP